jgi:nicotinamide-nucleotide amidase
LIRQLADEILEYARVRTETIVTAESCSAGMLALAFAKGEGASQYFMGGFVTYTKEMKARVLGVPTSLLREKTAVCGEVAEAMAIGALLRSGASVAVSITGVAGPAEDEDGNPVGLIYCGVARKEGGYKHVRVQCAPGDPDAIVDAACTEALRLLRAFCYS